MIRISKVPGFEGPCRPTWLNRNTVCNRLDGGVTGFFKNVEKTLGFRFTVGKEFHGIIKDGQVYPTTLENGHD